MPRAPWRLPPSPRRQCSTEGGTSGRAEERDRGTRSAARRIERPFHEEGEAGRRRSPTQQLALPPGAARFPPSSHAPCRRSLGACFCGAFGSFSRPPRLPSRPPALTWERRKELWWRRFSRRSLALGRDRSVVAAASSFLGMVGIDLGRERKKKESGEGRLGQPPRLAALFPLFPPAFFFSSKGKEGSLFSLQGDYTITFSPSLEGVRERLAIYFSFLRLRRVLFLVPKHA